MRSTPKIDLIKQNCEELVQKLNNSDLRFGPRAIDINKQRLAMIKFNISLKKCIKYQDLLNASTKFIEECKEIPRNEKDKEFNLFLAAVEKLLKVAHKQTQKQKILDNYLFNQNVFREKLNEEISISEQIDILNEIVEYRSEITASKKHILNKDKLVSAYDILLKQIQEKINKSLEELTEKITFDDIKLVSSIKSKNLHNLPDNSKNIVKQLLLKEIQEKIFTYKNKINSITLKIKEFKHEHQRHTESALAHALQNEKKMALMYNEYHQEMKRLKDKLIYLEWDLDNIKGMKYTTNASHKLSEKFATELSSTKKKINAVIATCDKSFYGLNRYINMSTKNIKTIENRIDNILPNNNKLQKLTDSDRTNFQNVDGKKFLEFKDWIINNVNYKHILSHKLKSSIEKKKDIADFEGCIAVSQNINELLKVVSPAYNRFPGYGVNLSREHININELHKRLRKTRSMFGFYKMKGYNSTTDKYLTLLEKDIIKYFKSQYNIDITPPASPGHHQQPVKKT